MTACAVVPPGSTASSDRRLPPSSADGRRLRSWLPDPRWSRPPTRDAKSSSVRICPAGPRSVTRSSSITEPSSSRSRTEGQSQVLEAGRLNSQPTEAAGCQPTRTPRPGRANRQLWPPRLRSARPRRPRHRRGLVRRGRPHRSRWWSPPPTRLPSRPSGPHRVEGLASTSGWRCARWARCSTLACSSSARRSWRSGSRCCSMASRWSISG